MKVELLDFKELDNYPSGSGIEFYDDKVFLVGETAGELLVMNKKWKKPERISLAATPKNGSTGPLPQFEAMTLLEMDKKPYLFIIGPGNNPAGSKAVLFNLETPGKEKGIQVIDLDVFYGRLKSAGLPDLNMEAIAEVYDYLVMVHRGNAANPDNYLVITRPGFWQDQQNAMLQTVKIDFGAKAVKGMGISGITYSDFHEDLFLTITTDAESGGDDAGGNSWLGVIENLYRKIGREKVRMKINELIDLPSADKAFKGYNFEAVCIQSEKDHSMKLQLVADNAAGRSFVFKVQVTDI
ncbi:MAG: hypothetical protein JST39_15195 [Bacteroidetes bacterium]|nr:hypothetical protein [Bacteroidota bacterium]